MDINLVHPPGFEPNLSPSCVNREETSIPPGFEGSTQLIASKNQGRSAVKRHIDSFNKRVTRSQSKIIKNAMTRRMSTPKRRGSGPGGKEGSPFANGLADTTESIRKLAKESLEVGELLGVKVVANRENAIRRITESLKKARVSKATHKTS